MVIVFVAVFAAWQIALISAMTIAFIWPRPADWPVTALIVEHFAAIVGLPAICVMAFAVVWSFRTFSGPIEFEVIGFKLRGASGPVVLWVATMLALTLAVRLLW